MIDLAEIQIFLQNPGSVKLVVFLWENQTQNYGQDQYTILQYTQIFSKS